MGLVTFNIDNGYLEAIVRGFKSGLLNSAQYNNLSQCESIDDIRLQLTSTDYGNFMQNEPSPIATSVLAEKSRHKLIEEFKYLKHHATGELVKFLDYITYAYMIDNIMLLVTGTLHNRDTKELLDKCHPLGVFDSMPALCVATNISDLYSSVIVETPLAPYFAKCLSSQDLDELNIEVVRNTLYKAYLEDFFKYCTETIGGTTGEVMGSILKFEADRRVVNITLNSFGTDLTKDDRARLFPNFGHLYPEGSLKLARADDTEQVKAVLEGYQEYRKFFELSHVGVEKSLEDRFFDHEVSLCKDSFMLQGQYGIFYALIKLKEQEIRNIVWIAECISQGQKDRVQNYIPIF